MESETFTREVRWVYHKTGDLEVHLSRLSIADETFLDVREYVPSRKMYGRGLTLPENLVPDLEVTLQQWF